jgi:tRNA 2-selenouridine synthase
MDHIQRAIDHHAVIIDVRSEQEFALGHIPTAVNIPILDNQERHLVGTTYKQQSSQEAVSLGLELFAAKAEEFFSRIHSLGSKDLIIYCWRGGMRSELSRLWLSACGFRVEKLAGGYKAFRHQVLAEIDQGTHEKNLIVLNGQTGVGKTLVIEECIHRGLPALDLEGMARHRGSLFGGMAQARPPATQQDFENQLALGFYRHRLAPTLIVEIEGAIGPVVVPHPLQRKIRASPMVYLTSPLEQRVAHLIAIYCKDWNLEIEQEFFATLEQFRRFLSKEVFGEVTSAITKRDFVTAISLILEQRYDKAYQKSLDKHRASCLAEFDLPLDLEKVITFLADKVNSF